MQETSPNLLEEFEKAVDVVPATPGLRLTNFIIDMLVIEALNYGSGAVIGYFMYFTDTYSDFESSGWDLFFTLIWLCVWLGYFTLTEFSTKGRTLGKFISRTQAIREDGDRLTIKDAFLRSLSRLVPFEPFSALGNNPWHDRWTKTMVIKKAR